MLNPTLLRRPSVLAYGVTAHINRMDGGRSLLVTKPPLGLVCSGIENFNVSSTEAGTSKVLTSFIVQVSSTLSGLFRMATPKILVKFIRKGQTTADLVQSDFSVSKR